MAERIGVCGDCKAKFKIPPTFQGAKAKCKKCGGVVNIPAAEAEAPKKPAPAKKAAPQVKKPAAAAMAPVLEPETDPELEAKEAPETESENTVDVPSKEEEVNPIIEFELVPPMAGCSQERFDELTEAYTNGYLKEDLPAYKRRKFKKTWDAAKEEGYDTLPILLNAFNGLDLLSRDDVAMGFRIAQEWNELSGKGYVDLNFKGDITDAEMHENLYNNVRTVTSLISLWQKKYADDGAQQEKFIRMVEKARASEAEKTASEDG